MPSFNQGNALISLLHIVSVCCRTHRRNETNYIKIAVTTTSSTQQPEQDTSTEIIADHITTDEVNAPTANTVPPSKEKIEGSEQSFDDSVDVAETGWSGNFNFAYLLALLGFAIFGGMLWYFGGARILRRFSRDRKGRYSKVNEDIEKAD
jgi:hypothetical protein